MAFPFNRFPPALFQTAAYGLQRVGCYVGRGHGKSWAAQKTWNERKKDLKDDVVEELQSIAKQHRYEQVERLIHDLF